MNPVIGLECIKGRDQYTSFLDRGVTYGMIFKFNHDLEGLTSFLNYIRGLESAAGVRPSIVMKATGHYHSHVIQFLVNTSI
jgi:transposase